MARIPGAESLQNSRVASTWTAPYCRGPSRSSLHPPLLCCRQGTPEPVSLVEHRISGLRNGEERAQVHCALCLLAFRIPHSARNTNFKWDGLLYSTVPTETLRTSSESGITPRPTAAN